MQGKIVHWAAALLGIASISSAQAVTIYPCNGCTEQLRAAQALSMGIGYHYIDDVRNNVAEKFQVTSEPACGHNQYFVDAVDIEPFVVTAFNSYRQFVLANGSSSVVYQNVSAKNPPNGPAGMPQSLVGPGGMDFVQTPANQSNASLWLADIQQHATDANFLSGSVSLALIVLQSAVAFQGQGITVEFNITLKDGSVVVFDLDAKGAHFVRATDSYGNPIPLTKAEARGRYGFGNGTTAQSETDLSRLIAYMDGLRVHTSNPTQGGKSIVCTPDRCTIEVF